MNRRLMLSTLIAGSATAALAPVAYGSASWCDDDPLVVITTPTLRSLDVHVTNSAEGEEPRIYLERVPDNQDPQNAWIGWSVVRSNNAGKRPSTAAADAVLWDVTLRVTIHTDGTNKKKFRTRSVTSSGEFASGTIYAQANGMSDRLMTMRFSMWA